MKRTNRFPLFLLMLVLLLAAALLASCGGDTETPEPDTPTPDNPPEHTHAYTDTVTAPTCTEPGYTTHTCSCGHSYTDTPVPATGHTEAIDPAVAPTKTEDGRTEGSHCSACHIVLVPQNSLHATGSLGLAYTVNEDGKTCTVTGIGSCTDTELVIPAFSPEDYPVTAVAASAFRYGATFTDILILGNVLTEIGEYAFAECTAFTNLTIPDSVTSIGKSAFYNCTSLAGVTIGNGVTAISKSAFESCTALTSVTFGNSVTEIGYASFYNCSALESITIPDDVTKIDGYAFHCCTSLTGITIPAGVTSIGRHAFSNSHFSEITFTGTKEQWKAITKGDTWDYYTRYYVVHCTDGDLTKEEAQK